MVVIIIICVLLLFAYVFDLTSAVTKIPSVILLLVLGWGIRQVSVLSNRPIPDLSGLLPIFGTLGLVLIVLEGALDLEMNRSKFPLVRRTFLTAIVSMLALAFGFAFVLNYFMEIPFKTALVNVIPICVISSSVAIASAGNLSGTVKEYVIYESSLSDILGVLFFNFVAFNEYITFNSLGGFGLNLVVMIVISLVATIALSFLLSRINHHTKYAPIIILMILIYALSEVFHLPALIFILFFGLFLGNIDELKKIKFFRKIKDNSVKEINMFRDMVREGTFLMKAFFFILFGYSFQTSEIINPDTLLMSISITASIFLFRWILLYIAKVPVSPLLYIAPRGLITILLFLAIPATETIAGVNKSLIIQVIVFSSLVMMIGMMFSNNKPKESSPNVDEKIFPPSENDELIIEENF
ncbi:MAG: cation:proton antiporter [Ginsengibacter sp.]